MTDHDLIQEARQWTPGMTADYSWRLAGRLADALEAAAARADQLEKALRWYADEDNYFGTYEDETQVPIECPALADEGTRARDALAGVPAEPATEEKPRVRSVYESLSGVPDSAIEPGDYV